jgi:hypothetical protein
MAKIKKEKVVYTPYSRLDKRTRKEKLKLKQKCNQLHAQMVKLAEERNADPGCLHAVLGDPSEKFQSPKALLAVGVDEKRIHIPNPYCYMACRGQGFSNVHNCLLSQLSRDLLIARKWASVFYDSTGTLSEVTMTELDGFLSGALTTLAPDYVVLSLTLARSRRECTEHWLNRVDSEVYKLIKPRGYTFYDLITERKYFSYGQEEWNVTGDRNAQGLRMHFFSWMLKRQHPVPEKLQPPRLDEIMKPTREFMAELKHFPTKRQAMLLAARNFLVKEVEMKTDGLVQLAVLEYVHKKRKMDCWSEFQSKFSKADKKLTMYFVLLAFL